MLPKRRPKPKLIPTGKPRLLPERKPPKEQWHPWLLSGKMTKPTNAIRNYAEQFRGKDLETVKKIVADLHNPRKFKHVRLDMKGLEKYYAKRTAGEIIGARTIVFAKKDVINNRHLTVLGCIDYCNALAAVLRYKGIPSVFVRRYNHSQVHFCMKEIFVADPTYNSVYELKGEDLQKFKEQQTLGAAAFGPDSQSVKIHSIKDIRKYVVPMR